MDELKHREYIVIKNTAKGDAVVILDVKDYIIESERQLGNTKHHRHLQHDSKTENNTAINKIIRRFKNVKVISKNVKSKNSFCTYHLISSKLLHDNIKYFIRFHNSKH